MSEKHSSKHESRTHVPPQFYIHLSNLSVSSSHRLSHLAQAPLPVVASLRASLHASAEPTPCTRRSNHIFSTLPKHLRLSAAGHSFGTSTPTGTKLHASYTYSTYSCWTRSGSTTAQQPGVRGRPRGGDCHSSLLRQKPGLALRNSNFLGRGPPTYQINTEHSADHERVHASLFSLLPHPA